MDKDLEKKKVMYLSYDGIMEPLGQSQVLSYLENLSEEFDIYLLSFEKKIDILHPKLDEFRSRLDKKNITWYMLKYTSKPNVLSTIYDSSRSMFFCFFIIFRHGIKVVHIRSLVPGFIVLFLRYLFKLKIIFDIRGFWADEKADRAGWSRKGILYNLCKYLERKLFKSSSAIVTLTEQAKEIILKENINIQSNDISVIRTCTDLEHFIPNTENTVLDNSLTLGHLGSVDTAYDIDPILKLLYGLIKINNNVNIIFFNKLNQNYILSKLQEFNIPKENFSVLSSEFKDLPGLLSKVDVGCFYAKECFSIKASMPTKIGEFLGCGKPVMCNSINKDVNKLFSDGQIGLLVDFTKELDYLKIMNSLNKLKTRSSRSINCRNVAEDIFSLEKGAVIYSQIYNRLFS